MNHRAIVIALGLFLGTASAFFRYNNPHYLPGRDVLVYLFEWKWTDIADECERFLGPKGFGGVQTSPVTENMITESRSWAERYLPISYRWVTRSGTEKEFRDMVRRCKRAGVRVYVDMVLNHMSKDMDPAVGTGGSFASTGLRYYPTISYDESNFHPRCEIEDWSNATQMRNCEILGHDLDQGDRKTWGKIVGLMNKLIKAGVAGFRIDAAGFMWPSHLQDIYGFLDNLNTEHNFLEGSRPYIYQEVGHYEWDRISKYEYNALGAVTEYGYSMILDGAFQDLAAFRLLYNLDEFRDLLLSEDAVVCISDHKLKRNAAHFDEHRNDCPYGDVPVTEETPEFFQMAVAFMLAYPYGSPMIMSSYTSDEYSYGPPADEDENIIPLVIKDDGSCEGGWKCEHRLRQVYNMVGFRNAVEGTTVNDWWQNDYKQLAFSRGSRAFIAINAGDENFVAPIPTKLQPGIYCDVISGNIVNKTCTGKFITVEGGGRVHVKILRNDENRVVAIHRNARLWELIEID